MSYQYETVSYAHRDEPQGVRFVQYKKDPIPVWAVDVQNHTEQDPLSPGCDDQVGLDA